MSTKTINEGYDRGFNYTVSKLPRSLFLARTAKEVAIASRELSFYDKVETLEQFLNSATATFYTKTTTKKLKGMGETMSLGMGQSKTFNTS